ncbi:MAG: hypothetical protein V7K39_02965 [Nostoc sp.]
MSCSPQIGHGFILCLLKGFPTNKLSNLVKWARLLGHYNNLYARTSHHQISIAVLQLRQLFLRSLDFQDSRYKFSKPTQYWMWFSLLIFVAGDRNNSR